MRKKNIAFLVKLIFQMLENCTMRQATLIGIVLAKLYSGFAAKSTQLLRKNIALYDPNLTEREMNTLCRRTWEHLGSVIGSAPHWHKMDAAQVLSNVDMTAEQQKLVASLQGRTCLYLSAHFGNWEILPRVSQALDLDVSYVYKPAKNLHIDKIMLDMRCRSGIHWLSNEDSRSMARQIVSLLRQGQSVGMLIDQAQGNAGEWVDFLGRRKGCTYFPAQLHLKYGIPIVIVSNVMPPEGGKCRVHFEVIEAQQQSISTHDLTQIIYDRFVSWIRQHPAQWLWLYDHWREDKN